MAKHYFKQCQYCGARLDPGERCDCKKAKGEARPERKSAKQSERRAIS